MQFAHLMISGKMATGKSLAADYLVNNHHAIRWTRAHLMKKVAHALIDQVGDLERLLVKLFPDNEQTRQEVRYKLLKYAAQYAPEEGKKRRLYQDVTEIIQSFDPLVFERELLAQVENAKRNHQKANPEGRVLILIDDIRSKNAFDFFAEHDYHTIRMEADLSVRRARMLRRDGKLPHPQTLEHPSETELDGVETKYVIINNDLESTSALFSKLDEIVQEIFQEEK
jgi:dephospho-CoA kinase